MKKIFFLLVSTVFWCACSEDKIDGKLNSKKEQSTMIDIDGNVYLTDYILNRPTIPVLSYTSSIGQQIWTVQNLNVSRYRNGDPIPQVADQAQWAQLTTGAWCYFNNDPANGAIYGKLYNWYAVNDPRGLAPIGYHVSTDSELTILTNFLGGQTVAGGKMKANSLWAAPNVGVTPDSRFSGLPGGFRFSDGTSSEFGYDSGQGGFWWSSTAIPSENYAWRIGVFNSASNVSRGVQGKRDGLSVRCVKD